jgi:hypothetical protein
MIYIPITYNYVYQTKRNEKAGHVASVSVVDKFVGVLPEKHEGKRQLVKPNTDGRII